MSRSVLREAVRVLASKGLLETKARLGARVYAIGGVEPAGPGSPELAKRHFSSGPFRAGAFRAAAGRGADRQQEMAARCIGEEALASLEASFRDMVEAGDDPERYFEPDFQFHQLILAAADNSLVYTLARPSSRRWRSPSGCPCRPQGGPLQRATPLHRAVLDAIRNRLPGRCARSHGPPDR